MTLVNLSAQPFYFDPKASEQEKSSKQPLRNASAGVYSSFRKLGAALWRLHCATTEGA